MGDEVAFWEPKPLFLRILDTIESGTKFRISPRIFDFEILFMIRKETSHPVVEEGEEDYWPCAGEEEAGEVDVVHAVDRVRPEVGRHDSKGGGGGGGGRGRRR